MQETGEFVYEYQTNYGLVSIIPTRDGRYIVMFQDEDLGSYHSPQAAVDDVSGGHTSSPSSGIDLGNLNIPGDISEWRRRTVDY
jgi:hypothetical protein